MRASYGGPSGCSVLYFCPRPFAPLQISDNSCNSCLSLSVFISVHLWLNNFCLTSAHNCSPTTEPPPPHPSGLFGRDSLSNRHPKAFSILDRPPSSAPGSLPSAERFD